MQLRCAEISQVFSQGTFRVFVCLVPVAMPHPTLLAPVAYLREIRDCLRQHEPDLWTWFSAERSKKDYGEELRLSLLKSADRLAPADHLAMYGYLGNAQRALGLEVPVTLYQSRSTASQPNATLFYLPEESHIVLSGPIMGLLEPLEWTAVFGHELAHRILWDAEGGDFLIADHILEASSHEPGAPSVYLETARRFRLNTEIFADRGALKATQNLAKTVSALVKISTGLTISNRESYLKQAAEIFANGEVRTSAVSHPEIFMRAHALACWSHGDENVDTWVRATVAAKPELTNLDLLEQQSVMNLTRRLLAQYLRPTWFQTDAVLIQARSYFGDFVPAESDDATLLEELRRSGKLLSEYFIFILLDFVRVDPDLALQPLAAALQWSERLGIAPFFEGLVTKELGVKSRELAKMKAQTAELIGSIS